MFTVIIAEKKQFEAIEENKLFYRPFLDKGPEKLAFCEWNPEGQTLYESVPKLIETVGRQKFWRAIIINESNVDGLNNTLQENPFDLVKIGTKQSKEENKKYIEYLKLLVENQLMPFEDFKINNPKDSEDSDRVTSQDIELWHKDSETKNAIRLEAEANHFVELINKNLARLSNALCYMPEEFERKQQKGFYRNDFYYNDEIGNEFELGQGLKRYEIEYSIDKEEKFRKIKKELLDSYLPAGNGRTKGSIGIALPTEVYCISERISETGFFSPARFWENHTSFEYSDFVSRNAYNEKMRFLVFDMLPETHVNYRLDKIRFLYNVLLLALNDVPSGTFQPRRLYLLDSENDEKPLSEVCNLYNLKLKNTIEVLQGKIKATKENAPKFLSDRDANDIFCKKITIPVNFDSNFSTEKLKVSEGYGIAYDSPRPEHLRWKEDYIASVDTVELLVKQPRRQLKKAIKNAENECFVDENKIRALNSFQMEDVKAYTEQEENKLIEQEVSDIFNIDRYYNVLDEENRNVKKEISKRMRKKPMILSVFLCLVLLTLCFIPMIINNAATLTSVIVGLIFMGTAVAVLAITLVIALNILKKPLADAMKKYNKVADRIFEEVKESMNQFSKYLSALCNVKRGYKVINYKEDSNIDVFDDRVRLLTSHIKDINEVIYALKSGYGDFIDDNYVDVEGHLSKPYEFNFEVRKHDAGKFDYPPPFPKEDYRNVEFLTSGNRVVVPSGFTKRVTVKQEEIYE